MTEPQPPITIDLNCDAGEATEQTGIATEARIFRLVSSVNIACGGHTGDDESMRRAVLAAMEAGCTVGAHPSYPDREGFGRRRIAMEPSALERELHEQIARLSAIAEACGVALSHVKPHGMLYHDCAADPAVAAAVANAARAWSEDLLLMGSAGTAALVHWRSLGADPVAEAFADRAYERDGSLRSRSLPGALILDPERAAAQGLQIARERSVRAHCGSVIDLEAQSICIHSDTPGSEAIARAVRGTLEGQGIRIGRA